MGEGRWARRHLAPGAHIAWARADATRCRAIVEERDWIDPVECPACLVVSRVLGLRSARVEARHYPHFLARLASLVARGGRTRAFVESFELLEAVAGRNPSAETKAKLNEAMLGARGVVEKLLEGRGVAGLLGVAAAANAVDVEMLDYRFGGDLLSALGEEPRLIGVEEDELEGLRGARIAWLLDNAGEAVVDMLVAARLASMGAKVVLYARSLDYETDVTAEEAARLVEELGLTLEVRGSGTRYPPHHPASPTREELERYDAVVAKGIANLEAALEAPLRGPRLVALLRAKCGPLARLLRVPKGKPVIVDPEAIGVRLRG